MSRHGKTQRIIDEARVVLAELHPMTVRQVYYQLVSRQVVENTRCRYQAVSKALVSARLEGEIPWAWIEDRLRRPRCVPMWDDATDFGRSVVPQYRRDVWASQPGYVEVWLEKDALSGVFEDVLEPYGVTLNVGRGYDGWDSIHNAAERYGDEVTVLYFGDFDPSGEDMLRSLRERLAFFDCGPEIVKCALTREDISRYSLPPALTKKADTRSARFVAEHGDMAVELDALPADVLRRRLIEEVQARMDLDALAATREREAAEGDRLQRALTTLAGEGG